MPLLLKKVTNNFWPLKISTTVSGQVSRPNLTQVKGSARTGFQNETPCGFLTITPVGFQNKSPFLLQMEDYHRGATLLNCKASYSFALHCIVLNRIVLNQIELIWKASNRGKSYCIALAVASYISLLYQIVSNASRCHGDAHPHLGSV